MLLIISSSLNPKSRSRVAAKRAFEISKEEEFESEFLDLQETTLPFCNADDCYAAPETQLATGMIQKADGIILATPVYNYYACSSAKNLIELSGKAWTEKVVGFLCAAGGQGSFMSMMSLANSLMLDFRSFIVPRFVYLTGEHFEGNRIADDEIDARLHELVTSVQTISTKLAKN